MERADRLRVLIVDERGACIDIALALQATGHEIYTAIEPLEAVALAARHDINYAIVDLGQPPETTGYQSARQIRAMSRGMDITIVGIADATGDEGRRIYHAGFDHHLIRPIKFDNLSFVLSNPRREANVRVALSQH